MRCFYRSSLVIEYQDEGSDLDWKSTYLTIGSDWSTKVLSMKMANAYHEKSQ